MLFRSAAGKVYHLLPHIGADDIQALNIRLGHVLFLLQLQNVQDGGLLQGGLGDVLVDGQDQGQAKFLPALRQKAQALADAAGGRDPGLLLAVNVNFAAVHLVNAENRVNQFRPSRAHQAGNRHDLPLVDNQGGILYGLSAVNAHVR